MIVGKVQRIKEKSTRVGTMYDIQVDGVWYGCGKIRPDCNEGDLVKFTSRQNGNFNNVQGGVEVLERGSPSAPSASGSGHFPPNDSRQNRIEFQNSRNVAAALLPSILSVLQQSSAHPKTAEEVMALFRDVTWDLMGDMEALDEMLADREASQ